jgi:SAM-dependent methyltransferase
MGHKLLRFQFFYDLYQLLVGGVAYRNRLIRRIYSPEVLTLVDLGCGTGAIIPLLDSSTKYIGIDTSDEYLKKAKLRGGNCQLLLGDVSEKTWTNGLALSSNTVATALGLFHHLDDESLMGLLSNCSEILPVGGLLVSVDPVIVRDSSTVARWFANNDRGKVIRSPEELNFLLRKFGFETQIATFKNQVRIPLDTIEITSTRVY